jgi:acetyl esterase/lipase
MALDPGAARLLRMLGAAQPGPGGPPSPAQRRQMLERLAETADEKPAAAVEARDLRLPGPGGPLGARLYAGAQGGAAGLVFFHGGGWVAGGLDTHDGLCRRLAASARLRLLAIDYRLAPEHPFPAAVEDALAATRWTAAHAGELGIDPARLAVGGDSVGGGLAAVVAQAPGRPPLALQVLICPILDLAGETPSRRAYARGFFLDPASYAADLNDYCGQGADLADPRLSPLLARELRGQPPALVHAAQYDPFRDEAEAYARRLEAAGTPCGFTCWPGMIHYFYCLSRGVRAAAGIVEAIGAGIGEALARPCLAPSP